MLAFNSYGLIHCVTRLALCGELSNGNNGLYNQSYKRLQLPVVLMIIIYISIFLHGNPELMIINHHSKYTISWNNNSNKIDLFV